MECFLGILKAPCGSPAGAGVCVSMELEWLQVRALWFGSATGRFYIGPNLRYCLPYLNIETVG